MQANVHPVDPVAGFDKDNVLACQLHDQPAYGPSPLGGPVDCALIRQLDHADGPAALAPDSRNELVEVKWLRNGHGGEQVVAPSAYRSPRQWTLWFVMFGPGRARHDGTLG
jgi:hypothetical protein